MRFFSLFFCFLALVGSPARAVDAYSLFPIGGKVDDLSVPTTLEDDYDVARITPKRAVHVNLRDQTGIEFGTSSNPIITSVSNSIGSFIIGTVFTTDPIETRVEKTTYTEQTTDAQRSIKSSNANDIINGTGARYVKIVYLTVNGDGPYTEIIALNGTACVITTATNIGLIEKMEVTEIGSTGSNVGILTLYSNTTCGATTIGTIAATDNITKWGHHYVPINKVMSITGISVSHNGTTVGSGATFVLKSQVIPAGNKPEINRSEDIRLYGQSSTFSRTYSYPLKIYGPSKVTMFVTSESSSDLIYRSAIDFYEQ